MLCEKCKKNTATTHIRSVVNGVVRELNLCAHCANEEGYGDIHHNGLANVLASMFGEVVDKRFPETQNRCSVCGSSFSDIAKSGKVGCAECYTTFKGELLPYLKRVHGSTTHTGKVPNSAPLIVKPKVKTIDDLRAELNYLVSEERYEEAAIIRDEIKKMEGKKNE